MLDRARFLNERRARHARQQRGLAFILAAWVLYQLIDALVARVDAVDRGWVWLWITTVVLGGATALGLFLYGLWAVNQDGRGGRPRIV